MISLYFSRLCESFQKLIQLVHLAEQLQFDMDVVIGDDSELSITLQDLQIHSFSANHTESVNGLVNSLLNKGDQVTKCALSK